MAPPDASVRQVAGSSPSPSSSVQRVGERPRTSPITAIRSRLAGWKGVGAVMSTSGGIPPGRTLDTAANAFTRP